MATKAESRQGSLLCAHEFPLHEDRPQGSITFGTIALKGKSLL
jgi:hypothetical protein